MTAVGRSSIESPTAQVRALFDVPKPEFRRWELHRFEDVSGVSGTGKVAEGIEFSNGKCAFTWLSEWPMVITADNLADIRRVHGHGGKTVVVYVD